MEALPLMGSIIAKRPVRFNSVVHAIEWQCVKSPADQVPRSADFYSLTSNSIRNVESARVSVPSFLSPDPASNPTGSAEDKQVWRTDLLATEPYWAGQCSYESHRRDTEACRMV